MPHVDHRGPRPGATWAVALFGLTAGLASNASAAPVRLAVLPVGYHEGYDRRLSNQGHVLVGGHRAPVRGRVCMNMTLVDVSDVPEAALEDEAVLLGSQGDERISAETLAGWCGTIHYEVVSRIHPSLPRVVV